MQGHAHHCYCESLINAAKEILKDNISQLALVHKKYFNHLQYKSDKAVHQLMQLPVVIFPIKRKLFVTVYSSGRDYKKTSQIHRESSAREQVRKIKQSGNETFVWSC